MNLFIIFITGLTTGGLTCLALQGGLLASVIASSNQTSNNHPWWHPTKHTQIIAFLGSKLIAHTILGFMLGVIGSAISISPSMRGWLQVIIAIYILGVAANQLELHPFFRYFIIKPPKFFAKLVRNESKSSSIFAPAILGAFTVLIPCATTQAMEVLAISTGNAVYSALIMFFFILGTTPTFVLFGFLLNSGSSVFQKYFPKLAATALIIMAIYSLNGAMSLFGSIYTLQNFYEAATTNPQKIKGATTNIQINPDGFQEVRITADNHGYSPSNLVLKKGVKTRLIINSENLRSCASSFMIPKLNLQRLLPQEGETVIEFTPESTGPLVYSCTMGMYTGQFNVIN